MSQTIGVDPITLERMAAFGRRRRGLIVLRGVCAAVVSLLGVMTVIALLDWLFVIPDSVRWGMSLTGYVAAITTVWITSVRMILKIPSQTQLARLVEQVRPDLREDLLSAIELGASSNADMDSPVFRRLLQESVAKRMREVDVESLLPWRMVQWWLRGTAGILAICLVLAFSPSLPFGQLLVRAALPMANIARVSDVQVTIISPKPHDLIVPQGDPVLIEIEVSKDEVREAILETFHPEKGRQRVSMSGRGQRLFSTNLVVGREAIEYRVLAGDAVTARYKLDPRARPYVTQFDKTYRFPTYTRMDEQTRREKDGNLTAVEGTSVALVLNTDQPATGELRLELGDKTKVIPLKAEGPDRLVAEVPIEASGTYKVHLTSAESGFENRFRPTYEISAQADLVPRVEILKPRRNLLLPPDEIVGLTGEAEDDLGLASVEQWIQVNNQSWVRVPLAKDIGRQTPISRTWDLIRHNLKAGDRVTTKLVAIDLKGSRGESAPLRLTISSTGFGTKRLAGLESKQKAMDAIERLAITTDRHRDAAAEAIDQALQGSEQSGPESRVSAQCHRSGRTDARRNRSHARRPQRSHQDSTQRRRFA